MNSLRDLLRLILTGVAVSISCAAVVPAFAFQEDESKPLSIEALPERYAFVNGDWKKFQAHQWMKNGYAGGVEDFSAELESPEDLSVEAEGRALLDQKDYAGAVHLKKGDDVFANFDFKQFPKYYSSEGGVYYPFRIFRDPKLNQELELKIGKFEVEAGLLPKEGRPEIGFLYEHEYKDGAKSSLAWGTSREGATSRKTVPAWRQIHETVDNFTLKGRHEIAGVTLKADQGLELFRSRGKLYQQYLSTNAVATQRLIRIQNTEPTATMWTTNVAADKWFLKEKAHAESAYRFIYLKNRENENLKEFNPDLTPLVGGSEQKFNAWSNNSYGSNRAVLGFTGFPAKWFMVSGRVKGELEKYDGFSTYPSNVGNAAGAGPPNGIIDRTETSDTNHNSKRLGESISLRFKKIPRTAFYSDFELEQISMRIDEHRQSKAGETAASATEPFDRETVTWMPRLNWTLGVNYLPWNFLNSTTQFRYRTQENHYDDRSETPNDATHDFSSFFQNLRINTITASHRTTYRPWRWFETSFRYNLRYTDYLAFTEGMASNMVGNTTANIFTYDARLMSLKNFFVTGSFNEQFIKTKTPARNEKYNPATPAFTSNSSTWLISFDYTPQSKISVNTTTSYTRARNFVDFISKGLPLGSDFDRLGVATTLRLQIHKNVTIEPTVSVYNYTSNNRVEVGDYTAVVVSTGVKVNWG